MPRSYSLEPRLHYNNNNIDISRGGETKSRIARSYIIFWHLCWFDLIFSQKKKKKMRIILFKDYNIIFYESFK